MKRKLFFHWDGKVEILSETEKAEIKEKTKRRAKRHFEGQTPNHRVIEQSPTSITFAYRRRSGGPVTIRWRFELVDKKSTRTPTGRSSSRYEVVEKPSPKKVAKKAAKRAKKLV